MKKNLKSEFIQKDANVQNGLAHPSVREKPDWIRIFGFSRVKF